MPSHNRRVRGGGGVWMYRWQRLKRAPFVVLDWLQDPKLCLPFAILAVLAECVINLVVIQYVRYTEIDWRAYMDEVEGVYNGTRDYSQLRGGTGPLVYPAGFVYAYLGLYHVTSGGRNMRLAQYIFAMIYLVTVCLVNRLYVRSRRVPPYVLLLMTLTSYRVHSIYVLRLFNDPVAMLLLYASLNCLLDARWSLASLLFSLAVSVKMSVLLFSPALLLAFIFCLGVWGTALQLSICAVTQLLLAAPFLLENPVAYLRGSFDLGRVFEHKWTVNWRFVPESVFVDRRFHVALLVGHLLLVSDFAWRHWLDQLRLLARLPAVKPAQKLPSDADKSAADDAGARRCRLLLLPLFTCNLIGVAFSRSLHYQFYVWYYHSVPFLLWSAPLHSNTRLLLLGVIELCWNTFPSTSLSSAALHGCHAVLVAALWRTVNSSAQVPIRKAAKTVDSMAKQQ